MRMKYLIAAILFCGSGFSGSAQEIDYSVKTIPDSLRANAAAFNKYDYLHYEVLSIGKARKTVHTIVTILNKDGDRYQHFAEYTDKFQSLGEVQINVYDSLGRAVQRIRKKDLQFHAFTEQLVDDSKTFYYNVAAPSYPFTVEMKYETDLKGTLHYPDFYIQVPGLSVGHAEFKITVPANLSFRHKTENISIKPVQENDGKQNRYSWTVKNLITLKGETGAIDFLPVIKIAPDRFEFGGYEGSLASWKEFGAWYGKLYMARDVLPAEKVEFFKQMVYNVPEEKEKIRKIYQYLQNNFRYVSIQLGIGGLQPFPADLTDKNKYGDCKALSNYTMAALKAIGIKSYNAIIYSDTYPVKMDPDFPKRRSNHVILCVPQGKDTIWLECTSKTSDFAYLGPSTENRNALLLTEKGGMLVSTPKSDYRSNLLHSYTKIALEETGAGNIQTNFSTRGYFNEVFDHYLNEQKADDQKEFLVNYMGFKQPDQFQIRLSRDESRFSTNLTMEMEKIHEFGSGSKMFIKTRPYSLYKTEIPKTEKRNYDFYFKLAYETSDTTEMILPQGFLVDALPKDQEIKNPYSSYRSKFWYDEEKNSVYSVSTLIINSIRIPANEYGLIQSLFDSINKEASQRIVIKRKS